MSQYPWRAILTALPIAAREAWGKRTNELTPEGTPLDSPLWFELERKAYDEIVARLEAGEFEEAVSGSDRPAKEDRQRDLLHP